MNTSMMIKTTKSGLLMAALFTSTALISSVSINTAQASLFPASINLSDLDGSDGFTINGIDAVDESGSSVSGVGDINGDGIDDLIMEENPSKLQSHY